MPTTRTFAVAAVTVAVASSVAIYAVSMRGSDPFSQCRTGAIATGGASIGGPFSLVDQDGRTVTDKDVLAKPALVYFGYTFCPDVCPVDVARNAEAVDALEEKGFDVSPVFISVDTKRDTPAVLKEWTHFMHPRMTGLTGTPDAIKQVASEYKVYYDIPADTSGDTYTVGHSTQTYLMLPKYGFVDFFTREDTADMIAERTSCFLSAAG